MRSGRTNDEVAGRSRRDVAQRRAGGDREHRLLARPRPDIAALDALGKEGDWEFDGVTLHAHEPRQGAVPGRTEGEKPLTKRDLIRYYAMVAPMMVPYLEATAAQHASVPERRRQAGLLAQGGPSHAPDGSRDGATTTPTRARPSTTSSPTGPPTLAWLANYGAVELHAWTSRIPDVHRPTYAMIDIDPGEKTTWDEVVTLARLYRAALDHVGVRGFPKVTGQRGIQIWVPIEPGPTFDDTRAWVEPCRARRRRRARAGELEVGEAGRGGLARLDYTQNAINKTLVAPYSVRAAAGAPVSMPIRGTSSTIPSSAATAGRSATPARASLEVGDLFAAVLTTQQKLPPL